MRKKDELSDPNSCLNKAGWDEKMIFVIRGHDITSSDTIRDWCIRRIKKKKNLPGDAQIKEALNAAIIMEDER